MSPARLNRPPRLLPQRSRPWTSTTTCPRLILNITEIRPAALLRARSALDDDALHQLQHSIATQGLRMPIEVWQLSTPRPKPETGPETGPRRYGLISGLRRLTA